MSSVTFRMLYGLQLARGGQRQRIIEEILALQESPAISLDDQRNEGQWYAALGGVEVRSEAETMLTVLLRRLRSAAQKEAGEIFDALEFFQNIVATAMWKWHVNVGEVLDRFAREFDRLDSPLERARLYKMAIESDTL